MRVLVIFTTLLLHTEVFAQERTNPFANPEFVAATRLPSGGAAPPELKLKAVMPDANQGLANINGKMLTVGESYLGYTLTEVTNVGVTLLKNGQSLELALRPKPNRLSGSQS